MKLPTFALVIALSPALTFNASAQVGDWLKKANDIIQPPQRVNNRTQRQSIPNAPLWEEIHRFTNIERQRHGLPPFKRDHILAMTAGHFSQYMATTGKYDHYADGRRVVSVKLRTFEIDGFP